MHNSTLSQNAGRGDINEGVVLFCEVGQIFKRRAAFSSQISPPRRFYFTNGATFSGGEAIL